MGSAKGNGILRIPRGGLDGGVAVVRCSDFRLCLPGGAFRVSPKFVVGETNATKERCDPCQCGIDEFSSMLGCLHCEMC